MEMHQIRDFLALCRTRNFTRAAESCNVSQPALSRAIRKLEDELGGPLFLRERGEVRLTDFGELVRPQLERLMASSRRAQESAQRFLKLSDAQINLGVMCTIGPLRIVGFLARFQKDNPGIELSLREHVPSRLSAMLREGEIDVAVMAQYEPFDPRFDAMPLYRERFTIAFPLGHRFAAQAAVRVKDIAGETYLSRANCEYRGHLNELCTIQEVDSPVGYRSEREDWIQAMVMAGMGICFLPEFSPVLPGLQTRPVVEPEVAREVSLVTVSGRRFSPPIAAFVKAIKRYEWPQARANGAPA